jgi:hypothetical protein
MNAENDNIACYPPPHLQSVHLKHPGSNVTVILPGSYNFAMSGNDGCITPQQWNAAAREKMAANSEVQMKRHKKHCLKENCFFVPLP